MNDLITGVAAGVPYVAQPPETVRPDAPVVLAWHLHDAPRTESAFAAALPLAGLDAWRIYLGLPNSGSRLPGGSHEEFMRLGGEDAVLNLYGPTTEQAVAEVTSALTVLRSDLGVGSGPLGFLGGSIGAAVALEVLADGVLDAGAAVVVSPLVQLRPIVAANEKLYGVTYPWSDASDAVAARMDYVARAAAVAAHCPAVRLVVGADDDADAVRAPAAALVAALRTAGVEVDLQNVTGMAHELAEAPGDVPAPQLPHAARVDALVVDWFRVRLLG